MSRLQATESEYRRPSSSIILGDSNRSVGVAAPIAELSTKPKESKRLEAEYADRQTRSAGRDIYSPFNPAALFMLQQRQRALLKLLGRIGIHSLGGKNILEVGCGSGAVLLELLASKADPKKLFGTDLLFGRVNRAHERLSHLPLICADGQDLPFADESFDIVLQFTVFSSILDEQVREKAASEMLRVLRRPNGVILWYDFWLNPVNRQTVGIGRSALRKLFPGCRYNFQRVTLAPPLARAIVPFSWSVASALEGLKVFNTHYLTAISRG